MASPEQETPSASRTGLELVRKKRSSPKDSARTSRNFAGRLVRPLASMVVSNTPLNIAAPGFFHDLPLYTTLVSNYTNGPEGCQGKSSLKKENFPTIFQGVKHQWTWLGGMAPINTKKQTNSTRYTYTGCYRPGTGKIRSR